MKLTDYGISYEWNTDTTHEREWSKRIEWQRKIEINPIEETFE